MSLTSTAVLSVCFMALIVISIYTFLRERNPTGLAVHLILIGSLAMLLNHLFGFPGHLVSRASDDQETHRLIVLFLAVLSGMIAQHAYCYLEQPRARRKNLRPAVLLAPLFLSPIVFIPVLVAFQNAGVDYEVSVSARLMLFLVAFENGFFWKEFIEHRVKSR